jgi:hypothetical protein
MRDKIPNRAGKLVPAKSNVGAKSQKHWGKISLAFDLGQLLYSNDDPLQINWTV